MKKQEMKESITSLLKSYYPQISKTAFSRSPATSLLKLYYFLNQPEIEYKKRVPLVFKSDNHMSTAEERTEAIRIINEAAGKTIFENQSGIPRGLAEAVLNYIKVKSGR